MKEMKLGHWPKSWAMSRLSNRSPIVQRLGNMTEQPIDAATKSSAFFGDSRAIAVGSCRFDKLDALYAGFVVLALIIEALRISVNTP
jgi:hypothetical protein